MSLPHKSAVKRSSFVSMLIGLAGLALMVLRKGWVEVPDEMYLTNFGLVANWVAFYVLFPSDEPEPPKFEEPS